MNHVGSLNGLPIACTLPTLADAKQQVAKWHAFDAGYGLGKEHTDTTLTIHYAKVEDSTLRLQGEGVR